MRIIKYYIVGTVKRARQYVRPYPLPQFFLHRDVPYFSQWESRELNHAFIGRSLLASDDPKWEASGAVDTAEYAAWSWSGCGMACTKMIAAHHTGEQYPLVTLGKKCADYGGYTFPLEISPGLYYKPYLAFAREEFGWQAKTLSGMSLEEVMYVLSTGAYLIASVSPHIRYPDTYPQSTGGHLVLLLGFNRQKHILYFHNPSGISKQTQEYATISLKDFQKFFSGRAIAVRVD